MEAKLKAYVESPITNDFGLSIEEVANACKGYGRFSAWLNGNISSIIEVLTIVKNNGMSPAYFASYEATEGYNSMWGWLNHTTQQGTYKQDAEFVANVVVNTSKDMNQNPSWIDYGNPVDFVPQSVKNEGNAHFNNLPSGTIGRSFIPLTAAATWEVYYPNGLKKEYNLIQDYGAPLTKSMQLIEQWGGNITGTPTNPDDPSSPEEPPSGIDIGDITNILNQGKEDLINSVKIDFDQAKEYIMNEFEKIFNHSLYNLSKDFETNIYFKVLHTFKNTMKINPTPKLISDMLNIVIEGLKKIEVTVDFDGVFDGIVDGIIGAFPIPDPSPDPDPEPEPEPDPTLNKVFPVRIQNGINFWKRSNWGVGTLQRNMTYGQRSNGVWHYGYDIGGGNNDPKTIYSVTAGEVVKANFRSGIGNAITIKNENDTYFIEYGHLDSFIASVGDKVNSGDPIGRMGATGGNYAVHLDIKIATTVNGFYAESTTIDPEKYLEITNDNQTNLHQP